MLETFRDAVEKSKASSSVGTGRTQKRRVSSLSVSSVSSVVSKPEKRKGLARYSTDK